MKRPGTRPNLQSALFIAAALLLMSSTLLTFAVAPAPAVEVGQAAPNFSLKSTAGKNISLSDYRGNQNIVLQFYVLDFTPG